MTREDGDNDIIRAKICFDLCVTNLALYDIRKNCLQQSILCRNAHLFGIFVNSYCRYIYLKHVCIYTYSNFYQKVPNKYTCLHFLRTIFCYKQFLQNTIDLLILSKISKLFLCYSGLLQGCYSTFNKVFFGDIMQTDHGIQR